MTRIALRCSPEETKQKSAETGSESRFLAANAALHHYGQIYATCDFVIDDGAGVPPHVDRPLRPLSAFVASLDRVLDGAIVGIKTNMIDEFFAAAFPRLRSRIVLVAIGSDWPTPGRHSRWLDDCRMIRWFGQNCDLAAPHPKFEPIPLGFAEPHWPHGDQEALLRVHRRIPPAAEKPLKVYSSFHLRMSHPERYRVWQQVRDLPTIDFERRRIPPELLWLRHAGYAFEICPRGAGLDCHRTWEALLLRTIPILQRSRLDPVYDGLPVVLIDDWRDITAEALARWQQRLADHFDAATFARLTARYWITRINEAAGRS